MVEVIKAQETVEGMVAAYEAMVAEFDGHPISPEGRFFKVKTTPGKLYPMRDIKKSFREIVDAYIKVHVAEWAKVQETRPDWDAKIAKGEEVIRALGCTPSARSPWTDNIPYVEWLDKP